MHMKQLIILPGNSLKNKTWGEVMLAHYGPRFDSAYMQSYEHWENDESVIDFDVELVKLRERTAPLFEEMETVVMAKSAGALLAFVAVDEGILKPAKCVFFGIPFDLAAEGIFKDDWSAVENFSVPALAFHNEKDPTADYRYTMVILAQYAPHIKLVTTYEPDHWYGNTDVYDQPVDDFFAQPLGT